MGKIQLESEGGSSPLKGSIHSEAESKKTKFVVLPQKIEFQNQVQQMNTYISEIAAGDCHALAQSQENVFAWGQGVLVSSENENQSEEVISNMPVVLGGGYQNKMKIDISEQS